MAIVVVGEDSGVGQPTRPIFHLRRFDRIFS
jgi:hypothetical protein